MKIKRVAGAWVGVGEVRHAVGAHALGVRNVLVKLLGLLRGGHAGGMQRYARLGRGLELRRVEIGERLGPLDCTAILWL